MLKYRKRVHINCCTFVCTDTVGKLSKILATKKSLNDTRSFNRAVFFIHQPPPFHFSSCLVSLYSFSWSIEAIPGSIGKVHSFSVDLSLGLSLDFCRSQKLRFHYGSEKPRIQTWVLGHRLLICSHRSLIPLLRTACFDCVLRCAYLFARSLTHSLPSLWERYYNVMI